MSTSKNNDQFPEILMQRFGGLDLELQEVYEQVCPHLENTHI